MSTFTSTIPNQYTLSQDFEKLLTVYETASLETKPTKKVETIKVNFVVSAAASIYEVIRNAVEYREQHLLHRAAIERILKRLIYLQNTSEETAETLIRELIWARYLENETIPETKIKEVALILDHYLLLWKEYNQTHREELGKRKIFDFLLELASCEIEENLSSSIKREAIFEFTYATLIPHLKFNSTPFTKEEKDLIIRVAIRKALLKSDNILLAYDLFKKYFPKWVRQNRDYSQISRDLIWAKRKIEEIIKCKITEKIFYYCRSNIPPFLILQDALEKNPFDVRQKVKSSVFLNHLIKKIVEEKYSRIRSRLTVATTRSIIYIFLTKMLLALIIEFPFERFVLQHINYTNLFINLIVPPTIMFLLTLTIRVPGEKNTLAIENYIQAIIYEERPDEIVDYRERKSLDKTKRIIFGGLYSFGFFITFGAIIYFLINMKFNILSGTIFILFLTIVSFFGFMIRQQVRDINLLRPSQSGIDTLTDFFAFPIIRTGSIISKEFAKWNITVYIFDVFIEAPFKTIIQLIEEWFAFIRERKDEIV